MAAEIWVPSPWTHLVNNRIAAALHGSGLPWLLEERRPSFRTNRQALARLCASARPAALAFSAFAAIRYWTTVNAEP